MIGAACNVVLNLGLTPVIGTMGAAIATAVSYMIVWVFRLVHSKKYIKLRIRLVRDCITYVLLVVQTAVLLLMNGWLMYVIEVGLFVIVILSYAEDLNMIVSKAKLTVLKRIHR